MSIVTDYHKQTHCLSQTSKSHGTRHKLKNLMPLTAHYNIILLSLGDTSAHELLRLPSESLTDIDFVKQANDLLYLLDKTPVVAIHPPVSPTCRQKITWN